MDNHVAPDGAASDLILQMIRPGTSRRPGLQAVSGLPPQWTARGPGPVQDWPRGRQKAWRAMCRGYAWRARAVTESRNSAARERDLPSSGISAQPTA